MIDKNRFYYQDGNSYKNVNTWRLPSRSMKTMLESG